MANINLAIPANQGSKLNSQILLTQTVYKPDKVFILVDGKSL